MRFTRLVAIVTTVALLGLPFLGTSANAAPAEPAAQTAGSVVASKPAVRNLAFKVVKRRGNLVAVGRVTPRRGPVIIQRATRCGNTPESCNFKRYDRVGTNKQGRFQSRVAAPARGQWYFRARVGNASSAIYVTCRTRTGSC